MEFTGWQRREKYSTGRIRFADRAATVIMGATSCGATAMTARRRKLQTLIGFGVAAVSFGMLGAGETGPLQEIAEGVYVRPGTTGLLFQGQDLANLGVVIGDTCTAVIDTGGSGAEGLALQDAIRRVTDVPVCLVINTHVHPDHMFGNPAFQRDEVTFAGHRNLPGAAALRAETYLQRAAEAATDPGTGQRIVLPERTIGETVQIDLGGRKLTVRAHATAHTDNDLSVLDERTGTLFAGDLVFLEHLPVLDGSINGWIGELERLMREDFERVVPGHGPARIDWPQGGTHTIEYLRDLRGKTRSWIARGADLRSAQEGIEAGVPERWQLIEEYHKRNVAAAFAELEWED